MRTTYGTEISREMVANRVDDLIGQFYKILPLKEHGSPTLTKYIKSLLREMLGMKSLMEEWQQDARYLSLIGILEYYVKNPDSDVEEVRSDVFKAINVIKQLQEKYSTP